MTPTPLVRTTTESSSFISSWLSKPKEILKSWILPTKKHKRPYKPYSRPPNYNYQHYYKYPPNNNVRIYHPKPRQSEEKHWITTKRRHPVITPAPTPTPSPKSDWNSIDRSGSSNNFYSSNAKVTHHYNYHRQQRPTSQWKQPNVHQYKRPQQHYTFQAPREKTQSYKQKNYYQAPQQENRRWAQTPTHFSPGHQNWNQHHSQNTHYNRFVRLVSGNICIPSNFDNML